MFSKELANLKESIKKRIDDKEKTGILYQTIKQHEQLQDASDALLELENWKENTIEQDKNLVFNNLNKSTYQFYIKVAGRNPDVALHTKKEYLELNSKMNKDDMDKITTILAVGGSYILRISVSQNYE